LPYPTPFRSTTKLVAGIGHRQWLSAFRDKVARKKRDQCLFVTAGQIGTEFFCQGIIEFQQARGGHRRRVAAPEEIVGQAAVAVVKVKKGHAGNPVVPGRTVPGQKEKGRRMHAARWSSDL